MTTMRPLTIDDLDEIATIVNSRSHFFTVTPLNKEAIIYNFQQRLNGTEPGHFFMGIFEENGTLDGFSSYKILSTPSPRADDFERTEKACFMNALWTLSRPNRVKIPTPEFAGYDRNLGTVYNEIVQHMEDQGIYTFWGAVPTTFQSHFRNPVYSLKQAKRLTIIGAQSLADGIPYGPLADYVKSEITPLGNPYEAMNYHVHTLLDQYRP